MTVPENTTPPAGGPAAGEPTRTWPVLRLVPWILGLLLCLLLVQHGVQKGRQAYEIGGFLALVIGCIGAFWCTRKKFLNVLSSTSLAVALLTIIAAATALGTLVPQNSPTVFLEEHYGKLAADTIGRLFLNDTFQSYWFAGLLALLALSLIVTVLRRPYWRPYYWGFFLGHGGMVVVLVGAAIGARSAVHGNMALRKGAQSAAFARGGAEAGGAKPGRHLIEVPGSAEPLEVQVRMTYTLPGTERFFRVAGFYPDISPRPQEEPASSLIDEPRTPALLLEEPAAHKPGALRRQWLFARNPGFGQGKDDMPLKYTYTGAISPLGFVLRLDDFEVEMYPDTLRFALCRPKEEPPQELVSTFRPESVKGWTALPESGFYFRVREFSLGTGEAGPGRHLIQVPGSAEPLEVEVGKTYTLPGTSRSFRVVGFYPDFSFSIEEKRAYSLSDEPRNPVLQVEEPGAGKDGAPRRQWLFARNPGHGPGENDLPLKYTYTGTSSPPSATVEIRKGKDPASIVETTMVPGGGEDSGCWLDEKHEFALVFEKKEGEPRAYRSKVSVLRGGKVVKEATVAVNAPLSYGGYEFYQSDWSSTDLNYSGIKVVKDPGLGLVYAGMIMLSAGVLFVFYIRPRIRKAGIETADERR